MGPMKKTWDEAKKAVSHAWGIVGLSISKSIFTPEIAWQKLADTKQFELLQNLRDSGPEGQAAAENIEQQKTRIGLYPQELSGAAWTWQGNIILQPDADLGESFTLARIVHENLHLRQPFTERLSARGELIAWQKEYKTYFEMTGKHYGEEGSEFVDPDLRNKDRFLEISTLSPYSRDDLERARRLMLEIAPNYQINKLPLQPIWDEIKYRIAQITKRFT